MRLLVALAAITCSLLTAEEPPKGVPARPSANDYAAQSTWQNATFAASLLPAKQVEHLFAFDISKSFMVFEVACYTGSAADTKLSRSAFVVKTSTSGDGVHNAEPGTVASAIQRQNLPSLPSHNADIAAAANIGYEHGTNPVTGRPMGGVYGGGGVGVEGGSTADRMPVPTDPKPGGTSEDRRLLETQLEARSLPEGPVHQSAAGYLFFRKSDLKAQPDGTYALEYLASDEGTGATHVVMLAVPKKAR